MTELQAPVKDVLRKTTTAAAVTRMWGRIEARGRARPRAAASRQAWVLIAAAVLTSAAIAGATMGWRPTNETARRGAAVAPAAGPVNGAPSATSVTPAVTAPVVAAGTASPPVPSGPPVRAATPETWKQLAARGENAKAYAQLGRAGLASAARSASVGDLFALADVARLSGHPADARAPLERIFGEHPTDGRASLAALTLGRVQLRSLGAPAAAATALERALALGLPAGLDEEAYGLLVEARATAGDRAGARAAYAEYVARFPASAGGRQAALRRWVSDP